MNMIKKPILVVAIVKFMFISVLLSRLTSTEFRSVVLESMQGHV